MANFNTPWQTKWEIPFSDINGRQYVVRIREQDYNGAITTLLGADMPFETYEDADADIYKPVRGQTGYLRVIDPDGTLLEQIIPDNNVQRQVELYDLTNSETKWRGFLSAQAYSQPWQNGVRRLEFPLKSYLEALEDVTIDTTETARVSYLGYYIVKAFDTLINTDANHYNNVYVSDDLFKSYLAQPEEYSKMLLFFRLKVSAAIFFDREDVQNDGFTGTEIIGKTYREILEGICRLFGICAREKGGDLYFTMYDSVNCTIQYVQFIWSAFEQWATGYGKPQFGADTSLNELPLLSNAEFMGGKCQAQYLTGAKSVALGLDLDDGLALAIDVPPAPDDSSTPDKYYYLHGGDGPDTWQFFCATKRFITPRTIDGQREEWYYKEWTWQNSGWHFAGDISCQDFLQDTTWPTQFTGAVPCRFQVVRMKWSDYIQYPVPGETAKSGLFMDMIDGQNIDRTGTSEDYLYSIENDAASSVSDGYINLNFNVLWLNDIFSAIGLLVRIKIGNDFLVYDDSDTIQLHIEASNGSRNVGKISTNKDDSMNVDGNTGFYIPIPTDTTLQGKVTIYFLDYRAFRSGNGSRMIISDLEVKYYPNKSIFVSERSSNHYMTLISAAGFSEKIEESLAMGTNNNNLHHNCFVQDNSGNDMTELPYSPSDNYEGNKARPEQHLLERMAQHYGKMRRTFTAPIATGLDLLLTRYTYDGRRYFGVVKSHDWRKDVQEVKFLEVEDNSEYYTTNSEE